jgi:hypothetical protein
MIYEPHNTNPKAKRSPAGNLSRCTAKAAPSPAREGGLGRTRAGIPPTSY